MPPRRSKFAVRMRVVNIMCYCVNIFYAFFGLSVSTSDASYSLVHHALVVAHHSEDISWLKHVKNDTVERIYVISSGERGCHELVSSMSTSGTKAKNKVKLSQPETVCEVIPNYGCEAGAYLHHLFTHYENLADHTLFLHAHQNAWHNRLWLNPEKKRWKALRAEEIVTYHNWNMNLSYVFSHYMRVNPSSSRARHAAKIFPHDIIRANVDVPGAAQFGVSRVRVHQYPRSVYERWKEEASGKMCGPEHTAGRGFANTWEILWPFVLAPRECVETYPTSRDCLNRVWFRKHIGVKKKHSLTKAEMRRRGKIHVAPVMVSSK